MSDDTELRDEPIAMRRKRGWLWAGAGAVVVLGSVWTVREPIADQIIASRLADMGLPVRYKIEQIGPNEEVLRDVVVGDAAHPDLTIARIVAATGLKSGVPSITSLRLEGVRIYGTMQQGRLGFGALDRLIYGPSDGKPSLPDMDLTIVDGRGRISGDFGTVGLGFKGSGNLRDGFAGGLAVAMPHLAVKGCVATQTALNGVIMVRNGRPQFAGPVRMGGLDCAQDGLRLAGANGRIELKSDAGLDGGAARVELAGADGKWGALRAGALQGRADATYRQGRLAGAYAGRILQVQSAGGQNLAGLARELAFEGRMKAANFFAQMQAEGGFSGVGVQINPATVDGLKVARKQAGNTPIGPLIDKMTAVLAHETVGFGAKLRGKYDVSKDQAGMRLRLSDAALTGKSGAALVTVAEAVWDDGRVSGRFSTGGGLPQIAGNLATSSDGRLSGNLAMVQYRAGKSAIALPAMRISQLREGGLAMDGRAVISGPIAGGDIRELVVPIVGDYAAKRGLRLGVDCVVPQFSGLRMASLTLKHAAVRIWPAGGGAILTYGRGGLIVSGVVPELALAGDVNGQPIALSSGPIRFGNDAGEMRNLSVTLRDGSSQAGEVSKFQIGAISGSISKGLSGRFSGADMALAAVPLDLHEGAGNWRFENGALRLSEAGFRMEDRITSKAGPDEMAHGRFEPLIVRDAKLDLVGAVIQAEAVLREPKTMRRVVAVDLAHDMASGLGHADLRLDALTFDKVLQPAMLSELTKGVIAFAQGPVDGKGRIDWDNGAVRSSGYVESKGLDFAADFGPARGVAGRVEFTDLLGLVTAPQQVLTIKAINPGIVVTDGILRFALKQGVGGSHIVTVYGAEWPFLDGRLELLPTQMTLGAVEMRRFELRVSKASAARFIEKMELGNIAATGVFNGRLPLVFDDKGGRIAGGFLIAEAPGGTLAYVGELSYKDLSPMANFAFQTLRSLTYKHMQIGLDGSISGEIVSRISMAGVKQGAGAKSNFLTRKIANLPIKFNINLRAPFFQLITSFKSFYDPQYLPDPMSQGLVGTDGKPILPKKPPISRPISPLSIQPPVGESKP